MKVSSHTTQQTKQTKHGIKTSQKCRMTQGPKVSNCTTQMPKSVEPHMGLQDLKVSSDTFKEFHPFYAPKCRTTHSKKVGS